MACEGRTGQRRQRSGPGEVPFGEVDRVVLGDALKYWQEGVRSLEPGCRWWDGKDYLCPVLRDSELCPPCHILTGWYDFFLQGALEDYRRAARVQPAVRLTVGGFGHWGTVLYPDLVHNCVLDVFERHLKGKDYRWLPISAPGEEPPPSRRSTDAPVQALCIGLGWRGYKTWPPPAAEVVFGLDSQGTLVPAAVDGVAASREHSVVRLPKKDAAKGGEGHGEGLTDLTPSDETAGIEDERSGATASSLQSQATNALLPAAPLSEESSFTFVYDPRDPTPCAGGPSFNPMNGGRHAQGDVERRKDVLLFTSAPLPEGMLIVGRVAVDLRVRCEPTVPSLDLVARLCEVDARGTAWNVCEGLVTTTDLRDAPQSVVVHLHDTATYVRPGHRLRLHVCCAAHPRWLRCALNADPLATRLPAPGARVSVTVLSSSSGESTQLRLPTDSAH